RLAPYGTIGRKVGTCNVSVTARHLGDDELRGTPGIESARARGRDPPQRRFELALAQRRIGRERAEAPMQLPEARPRTRDAGGASADRARVRNDLTGRVEVHAGGRAPRGALAVVEEVGLAVEEHGGKAAAAEVAGFRIGDREGEGNRYRGVDRVPAG